MYQKSGSNARPVRNLSLKHLSITKLHYHLKRASEVEWKEVGRIPGKNPAGMMHAALPIARLFPDNFLIWYLDI